MRILVLNYEYPPLGGGASPASADTAKRYVAAGHSVHVVTMGFKGLPAEETVDGVRVTRVPALRKRKEMCTTPEMLSYVASAIRYLSGHLKRESYDVCHAHFLIPTGLVALYAKRRFGLSYIVTPHGSDVPGYNEDRFTMQHRLTAPILHAVARNASAIAFPSAYLKRLAEEQIGKYGHMLVVPNGIDASDVVPGTKKPYVLSTGRLLPRKGFQHLIAAVSEADLGYEVHICGDGPMRVELERMAASSKTKIVFHGWIENRGEEYRRLLSEAALYVLASSRENASVSLLEAMSAGCAVVTTDVSGCPETVADAGLLVPPEDADAIADALRRLVDDARLMAALQRKARERVLAAYDWSGIIERYEHLLEAAR